MEGAGINAGIFVAVQADDDADKEGTGGEGVDGPGADVEELDRDAVVKQYAKALNSGGSATPCGCCNLRRTRGTSHDPELHSALAGLVNTSGDNARVGGFKSKYSGTFFRILMPRVVGTRAMRCASDLVYCVLCFSKSIPVLLRFVLL
jgi:hypothetical protein